MGKIRKLIGGTLLTKLHLGEHMQPWKSQSIEEGQNHFFEELVWQHQCSLHATWEAQKGTMHGKTHHCFRTPSWPIGEKDQFPW